MVESTGTMWNSSFVQFEGLARAKHAFSCISRFESADGCVLGQLLSIVIDGSSNTVTLCYD